MKFPCHELSELEIKGLRLCLALAIKGTVPSDKLLHILADSLLREDVSVALENMGRQADELDALYKAHHAD